MLVYRLEHSFSWINSTIDSANNKTSSGVYQNTLITRESSNTTDKMGNALLEFRSHFYTTDYDHPSPIQDMKLFLNITDNLHNEYHDERYMFDFYHDRLRTVNRSDLYDFIDPYKFGFSSVETLNQWFGTLIPELRRIRAVLCVYDVDPHDVVEGNYQCIFKNGAKVSSKLVTETLL